MFAITGASGQLGRLVLKALMERVDPARIVGLVRDPSRLDDLAAAGLSLRAFDYNAPDALAPALAGVDRLLLISSSEIGRRTAQHRAVIEAAKAAGVGFIAYTSILHADDNPLDLALEHRATEALLKESGIAYALLRNGWYNENYLAGLDAVAAHGVLLGAAGDGRVSSAARADYAAAAAKVLTDPSTATRVYELAGDDSFSQAELAALIAQASGKTVVYKDLPEDAYSAQLQAVGLPAPIANILADSSAKSAQGALFDDSRTLSALIGRPTTPIATSVAAAFRP